MSFSQNNPFSPLRIFVPDSDVIAFDFKSIGNINSDSFGDYTYRLISQSSFCGKQQVFRGGSILDTIPIYNLTAGGGFTSFVKAGDLNGDGYSDFLSTPSPPGCPYLPNQVTAYWGTAAGIDTVPTRLLPFPVPAGGQDRDEVVSNVDINGDGNKDILLLSLRRDSGNAVYLFKGKPGGVDSFPSWKISTPPFYPSVPREIRSAAVGDLNKDGFDDILVGKVAHDFQDSISGRAEIFLGGSDSLLDTLLDFVINPPTFNTSRPESIGFGSGVKFLGDLSNDGWPEFSVGGLQFTYSCPPVNNWEPAYRITGAASSDLGDVNGDGFLDLMIGFPTYPPPFGSGGVLFYLGGSRFDTIPDAVITDQDLPPDFLENIGRDVGFIGDINGDSAEDFMFLADRIIPANRHEVFIFAGNTTVKTGVEDGGRPQIPRFFELFQNSPNPFTTSTKIGFKLKSQTKRESVRLEIYNLLGQRIRTLLNETGRAGEKSVEWDGKDERGREMPSGIYLYKLTYGSGGQVKKMILIR